MNDDRPAGGAYAPPSGLPRVLHLDPALLVIDKPSGLLSVPGRGLPDCAVSRCQTLAPGCVAVHRLDRDTSGVMVLARTREALRHLGLQFERRRVRKRYRAVVAGEPVGDRGVIDAPLMADWPNRPRQMIHPDGRPARTRWVVTAREGGRTRLVLFPVTGRSHQLRVHLANLGNPILGDPLYGDGEGPRMMLHAERLRLRHPDGGRWLTFEAPCPF